MSSRRKFGTAGTEPTRKQRTELRTAALRRWDDDTTMGTMAIRLKVPESWLWQSLAGTMRAISQYWGKKPKGHPDWSGQVASELRLPRCFVAFTFRHLWGANKLSDTRQTERELRRLRSDQARTEHINAATGSSWS